MSNKSELFHEFYSDCKYKDIHDVCAMYGGLQMYVPVKVPNYDSEIVSHFNGGNHLELAKKYRVSTRSIHRIISKHRRLKAQKRLKIETPPNSSSQ